VSSEPFYHVRVRVGEVGRFALLPGDPARVRVIGEYLRDEQDHSLEQRVRGAERLS
jgi:uridine phosphorylase